MMVANLIHERTYLESDNFRWTRSFGIFVAPWIKDSAETAEMLGDRARKHFHKEYLAQFEAGSKDDSGEELLCNTLFSLAYGALLLLSHTTLRLVRGRRYGILGPNGSGKTTLMRSLNEGKVENFPPQEVLRSVMVEHSLQGEYASLSVIDFIAAGKHYGNAMRPLYSYYYEDKKLAGTPKSEIIERLKEVGFDDKRQTDVVGGLSGGWKMKLELARAMLYNADLLLLDEVCGAFTSADVFYLTFSFSLLITYVLLNHTV